MTINKDIEYVPVSALIFYRNESDYNIKTYCEFSQISNGNIQTPRPLTKKCVHNIKELVDSALTNSTSDKEYKYLSFSERKILYNYKNVSCWAVPAHENNFIFEDTINRIHYPNLIFVRKLNQLYVYSYKGKLTKNTKLYRAPFPNIYADATLCFGTMNVNELLFTDSLKTIHYLEDCFFNSAFNTIQSKNRTKSNTYKVLKELIISKKSFITRELVSEKKRISDVIPVK
jgi:PRTRC genetic system protein B